MASYQHADAYRRIRADSRLTVVEFNEVKYSVAPMASWGYRNCNGVVLFGKNYSSRGGMVLSHQGKTKGQPSLTQTQIIRYLTSALSKIREANIDDVVAAVMAGDKTHFDTIVDFLEREDIEINGRFIDNSPDDENLKVHRPHKDLVVSPETGEAIICLMGSHCVKLL